MKPSKSSVVKYYNIVLILMGCHRQISLDVMNKSSLSETKTTDIPLELVQLTQIDGVHFKELSSFPGNLLYLLPTSQSLVYCILHQNGMVFSERKMRQHLTGSSLQIKVTLYGFPKYTSV